MSKAVKAPKNDNEPKWYIVGCRPNAERLAGEEIISLGQTVYVPCFRKEFHHRRMRKWIKRYYPLLPGYLFVLASDHWSRVLDCDHVNRILRSQNFGEVSVPIAIAMPMFRQSARHRMPASSTTCASIATPSGPAIWFG